MVGIVVVSHSHSLVAGLQDLVAQMVPEMSNIVYVGGTGDPENPIGTDPMQVLQAINQVGGADGVLVLMDLGSALLSAETALDFLEELPRERVRLSSAPLVEGTLSAAIQASMGADLELVAAEAESALTVKVQQLGETAPDSSAASGEEPSADALELELVIQNANGLHARPAARLVTCAGSFAAKIWIQKNGTRANAKSINQVATLGIRNGDRVVLTFAGADAAAAKQAVAALHAENFGETENLVAPAPVAEKSAIGEDEAGVLCGVPVARGIAIGPVQTYVPTVVEVPPRTVTDSAAETDRLKDALQAAVKNSEQLRIQTKASAGKEQAEIFEFHKLLLQDEETVNKTIAMISGQQQCAEYAWKTVTDAVAESYAALNDDYLRARAADVYDIQQAVLLWLGAVVSSHFAPAEPVIVFARELSPSEVADLPQDKVLGLCLATGGGTSHAAIIAAARGIPAVVGVKGALAAVKDGQLVILDGEAGRILTAPDSAALATYRNKQADWLRTQEHQRQTSQQPAVTTDGVRIGIEANIGGAADLQSVLDNGAEGVGLFRTEFLFLDRNDEPDEDEQCEIYRSVAEGMGERPVIIRTLDIGGDKPVPYVFSDPEENPFLGLRGIRLTLANRELFLRQLRAILRASVGSGIKIMFPMISTLGEFQEAVAVLDEAKAQLRSQGVAFNEAISVGVMIEVPAAVASADQLAAAADFFSIGTNDLAQYVMAADRGNPNVASLPDPFQPAVLRMIKQTVSAGHDAGIPVGMCGAFAGLPEAAGLLVGLGLDELSMNAAAIPAQKDALRQWSATTAAELARDALAANSAADVRQLSRNRQPAR